MNLLPILRRDLRSELQSCRLAKARLWAAVNAGVILLILIVAERWNGGVNLSRVLRLTPVFGMIPFTLFIIGLSRGSALLVTEQREEVLPLLLLSHLTGYDVVLAKMSQALVIETMLFLAPLPALVLPLVTAGFGIMELSMIALGCFNVLFCAMALGLLSSLFGKGSTGAGWCLFLFLPLLAYSSSLGFLIPSGRFNQWLATLQWLNPCSVLTYVQFAAAGFLPGRYWWSLLSSHLLAWCVLGMSGGLIRWACQRRAGADSGRPRVQWSWPRGTDSGAHRRTWRTRLLDRNAFLWLTSRENWPTLLIWLLLLLPVLLWGWLIWLSWVRFAINILIVLVIAVAASWLVSLLLVVPREACRRLVEDRQSGAMELLVCTPLDIQGIVRGQWLSLARRYLWPVLAVLLLSSALMVVGYRSFGFGGMLDPEDRGLWLFCWLTGIVFLPFCLVALCWVAMRRALLARNAGDASTMALLQVIGFPGFGLWAAYWLAVWAGCDLGWWIVGLLFVAAYGVTPVACAWRARRIVLNGLRLAAANRYAAALRE